MSFGKRLADIRREKKLSQGELAKKVGIHINVLGRYEREEARPFVEVAAKLANALEVSLDFLVGNTDLELEHEVIERVVTIQSLPNTDREYIMFTLDALLRDAKTRLTYN